MLHVKPKLMPELMNSEIAWYLGKGPIPSLCEVLETKGIKVIEDDLPESINGLGCYALKGGETCGRSGGLFPTGLMSNANALRLLMNSRIE